MNKERLKNIVAEYDVLTNINKIGADLLGSKLQDRLIKITPTLEVGRYHNGMSGFNLVFKEELLNESN